MHGHDRGRALSKSFVARVHGKRSRVAAVVDVSFTAGDGAITALLGPNGAGKTTTLRMIGTLVDADAGRVRVGGLDVSLGLRALTTCRPSGALT